MLSEETVAIQTYTITSNQWKTPLPVGEEVVVDSIQRDEKRRWVGTVYSSERQFDGTYIHTIVGATEIPWEESPND